MKSAASNLILPHNSCLVLQPILVKLLGKSKALFLQQVHYWITCEKQHIGKIVDQRRWIYNSAKEWAEQLLLSERQVSRIIENLKDRGILMVGQHSHRKSDRTNWYTINYEALKNLVPDVAKQSLDGILLDPTSQPDKMSGSSRHDVIMYNKETEITSEINSLTKGRGKIHPSVEPLQVDVVEENDSKIKNNLAMDLLDIWNQVVRLEQGEGVSLVQMTKKRAQYLVAAFKLRFESDITKWKQFCQKVASSDFLMGKSRSAFKATLDWILKFDVIQKIIEGNYGVKDVKSSEESLLVSQEGLVQQIETTHDSGQVKQFRKSILQVFGEQIYQSWFGGVSIVQRGGALDIQTTSSFARDYIQTHYLAKLDKLFKGDVGVFC